LFFSIGKIYETKYYFKNVIFFSVYYELQLTNYGILRQLFNVKWPKKCIWPFFINKMYTK